MLERLSIGLIQWLCWAALNIVLFTLAIFACVLVGYQIFEGVYSLGSLSVYEVAFLLLLVSVLRRCWHLNTIAGIGFGSYLYCLMCNLAYWMGLILSIHFVFKDKALSFVDSANGGLMFLGSFLLAIYASATFKEQSLPQRDSGETPVEVAKE